MNIVLFVMDAVSAKHCGCYGYDRGTTPNLDRIARSNYLYKSAIATATWTLPSYASMCSGLYPSQHGQNAWLDGRINNHLVRRLGYLGYHTVTISSVAAGFAKAFHSMADDPVASRAKMFKQVPDALTQGLKALTLKWPMHQSLYVRRYLNTLYHAYRRKVADELLLHWVDWGTGQSVDSTLELLDRATQPTFVHINSCECHWPYLPVKYLSNYLPQGTTRVEIRRVIKANPAQLTLGHKQFTPREQLINRALYDAALRYLDEQVGRLYDGLNKDDMLIVTADHGEALGEGGLYGHGLSAMPDALLRVPLVVKYPDRLHGSEAGYVELRQLYRHILNLARGQIAPLEGREFAYAEHFGDDPYCVRPVNPRTDMYYLAWYGLKGLEHIAPRRIADMERSKANA